MFIKFANKLINTAQIDKIEQDKKEDKFTVDAIFSNSNDTEVHYDRELFPTKEEADKRFAELEAILCGNPIDHKEALIKEYQSYCTTQEGKDHMRKIVEEKL